MTETKNNQQNPIMKHFKFDHLPERLAKVSQPFCELAIAVEVTLPGCAEKSTCLRKILEAKDCAVRAETERP